MPAGLGRRAFLKAAGALGLLALVPARRLQALAASAPGPGQAGRFLTAHELDTLRAVTARFVPGPPDDPDPGALEAGVAEAIDLLLVDFGAVAGPPQVLLLSDQTDEDLQTFVGAALANTLEAMYGPPEYGGNRSLVGWGYTRWPGDLQPRGSTDAEVSQPGPDTGSITGAMLDDLQRFLPALAGQRASRTQFWLGRSGMPRS